MIEAKVERSRIWSAVAAAVLAASVDAVYLTIIASEGELESVLVLAFASSLALAALALAVASRPVAFRLPLLVGAAVVLVIFTVLGAASLGLFLLPAAVLAVVAAARAPRLR